MYFKKGIRQGSLLYSAINLISGTVTIPSDTYYTLIRWIMDKNDYQIGRSGLYLNPYQPDIFKACFKVVNLTYKYRA